MDSIPFFFIDLNIDIAFKITWVSFMGMRKLTYIAAEAKKIKFA